MRGGGAVRGVTSGMGTGATGSETASTAQTNRDVVLSVSRVDESKLCLSLV